MDVLSTGVDIGRVHNFTALVTAQGSAIRHAERVPLSNGYPAIIDHIERYHGAVGCRLVMGATGVGRAVFDTLVSKGVDVIDVLITGEKSVSFKNGIYGVPKRELLRPLRTVLENQTIQIAKGLPAGDALVVELKDFRREVNERGHDTYGGKVEHDDLVIARALALWCV